jgi:hypothetical protein
VIERVSYEKKMEYNQVQQKLRNKIAIEDGIARNEWGTSSRRIRRVATLVFPKDGSISPYLIN